ncbi:MAG TPA: hypothetical protein VK419_05400 [Bryobacteraceae bacterium]|nr:hypothetical protein [Bryobacteraceae bacterium]
MRLVILLAIAFAMSTVQCAASCAGDDCGAKSQPCHQHDSSKQLKCAREIPAAKTPTIVSPAPVPAVADFVTFAAVALNSSLAAPRQTTPPPLFTLRI